MRVTIHQPDFMPWLGFFQRWAVSDLLILLDDVQYIRRGWQHRDKIKTKSGATLLTVPIIKKGRFMQKINQVRIDNNQNWRKKHLKTIETAYKKAPNFECCFTAIRKIYEKEHSLLIDFNVELLAYISSAFKIVTPIVFASEYNISETSTSKLILLTQKVFGDTYLSGIGAKDYIDETLFKIANITIEWQNYLHPEYPQLHGTFISMLSAIDYLMMNSKSELFEF